MSDAPTALVPLALALALAGSACGPSAHTMHCAEARQMPGEEHPLYVECWDAIERCRPNSHRPKQCDRARTVEPYGFAEERMVAYGDWIPVERWFESEAECAKAHAEPPNGTRGRGACRAR